MPSSFPQSRCARSSFKRALAEQLEDRKLLAALGGFVFLDADNDGVRDTGEAAIPNVTVTLSGRTSSGIALTRTVKSGTDGLYAFFNLPTGTYTIRESQPSGFADGKDSLGRLGGTLSNDTFSNIRVLTAASCSGSYNFGERPIQPPPPPPQPGPTPPPPRPAPTPAPTPGPNNGPLQRGGTTATIGFWHNKNGQALLRLLNGGPSATQLGNWLAVAFPNLFGPQSPNNLAGKTNSQVAEFYLGVFKRKGGPKVEAQFLTLAFNVYVTDSDLAGTAATRYGFKVSAGGTGAMTWNIGSAGSALGVPNVTTLSVMQILQAINARSTGGVIHNGNHSARSAVNDVMSKINEFGDRG